ncbi:MAG: hypothetical protein JW700_01080 [Candidatus Aenigmarchaeota archaeon]|nr:hypothetical protein [Candidatus Aenigmarchaeota archaeon]
MNLKTMLLAFVVVFILLANMLEPPEPQETVSNTTVNNYSNIFFNYDIIRYPSCVEVTSGQTNSTITLGFATESWNINFGAVPANGSYSTRTVDLSNSNEHDVEIILKAYGNISNHVSFSKNNILLNPEEKTSVSIIFTSNEIADFYSGEIDVIIKKPIYNFPVIV